MGKLHIGDTVSRFADVLQSFLDTVRELGRHTCLIAEVEHTQKRCELYGLVLDQHFTYDQVGQNKLVCTADLTCDMTLDGDAAGIWLNTA